MARTVSDSSLQSLSDRDQACLASWRWTPFPTRQRGQTPNSAPTHVALRTHTCFRSGYRADCMSYREAGSRTRSGREPIRWKAVDHTRQAQQEIGREVSAMRTARSVFPVLVDPRWARVPHAAATRNYAAGTASTSDKPGSWGGTVVRAAAFRCRFSSFFCLFNRSRWRLANG